MLKSFAEITKAENRIPGVEFKPLKTFPDERGFFRELVRETDPFFKDPSLTGRSPFSQWSHSKMGMDTVKAWHFHHQQIDWWYVALGAIHVALVDFREESSTYKKKIEFLLGDSRAYPSALEAVVRIPQGVLHGCRVLTDSAHLFYITSRTYNPRDEGRYPYNSELVPHDWGKNAITVENDRKLNLPPYERMVRADHW